MNSKLIDKLIKPFSSKKRGFSAPSVIEKLNIPAFDSKNKTFTNIIELSRKTHNIASNKKKQKELKIIDDEIDTLILEFYSTEKHGLKN